MVLDRSILDNKDENQLLEDIFMALGNPQQPPKMNHLEVPTSERMSQVGTLGRSNEGSYISESEPCKQTSNIFGAIGGSPSLRGGKQEIQRCPYEASSIFLFQRLL